LPLDPGLIAAAWPDVCRRFICRRTETSSFFPDHCVICRLGDQANLKPGVTSALHNSEIDSPAKAFARKLRCLTPRPNLVVYHIRNHAEDVKRD
jgi:hypothetical protein